MPVGAAEARGSEVLPFAGSGQCAPTLHSERGPVLRLPTRSAGAAHVHPLRPLCQLWDPAGHRAHTQLWDPWGTARTPHRPALPHRSTPSRTLCRGGSSPPSFSHSRRARGSDALQANSAMLPTPLTRLPGVTRTARGPPPSPAPSPAWDVKVTPGTAGSPSAVRGTPALTVYSDAGEGLGSAHTVGDQAAVCAGVGGQRGADAQEAGTGHGTGGQAAVELVPSVEQWRGAVGQALQLHRVARAHRAVLR